MTDWTKFDGSFDVSLLVTAIVGDGDMRGPRNMAGLAQGALRAAVKEAADNILEKGRADISAAGNFGGRWTEGLQADVSGDGDEVDLRVTEAVNYWTVFQFGATIQGRPLLFFKPTKAVGGLAGMAGNLPMLISKHSVSIPKKFHLIEIATEEAGKVPLLYQAKIVEVLSAATA